MLGVVWTVLRYRLGITFTHYVLVHVIGITCAMLKEQAGHCIFIPAMLRHRLGVAWAMFMYRLGVTFRSLLYLDTG